LLSFRWENRMFDYVEHFQHPVLNISCNSDALIAREVRTNGMNCMPYFVISVILVYCFILITNYREHFPFVHSMFMAFLGIAGPFMAVGTTYCLLFLFGFPFNSITLVMPFLIIGVGSDDVFIIIHAMRKTNKKMSLEDQIAETMEEAGPSITVTSLTNILSFAIGILTPTPAISIFCLYTCVGLAVDFVYQVTATLSLRSVHPADPNGIVAKYCRVLKMKIVLVFVNNPPDLSLEDNQRRMLGLASEFESLRYSMGKNSTSFWLRSFLYQSALYHTKEGFYTLLDTWLQDTENGGSRWSDMVQLKRNMTGAVVGVNRFMFATAAAMGEDASWNTRARLQHSWRAVAKRNEQFNVTIFQMYSFYVDQLDSIASNTFSTVIVAAITMDLACFLMIPHASSIISRKTNTCIITCSHIFSRLCFLHLAHISYHFYRNPASWTTDERLADALRSIGWPMIQAGCSTILCISPLLLTDSYMVYVFTKTVYLVIGLGLLHGIVFLPALLLTISSNEGINKKVVPTVDDKVVAVEITEIPCTQQNQPRSPPNNELPPVRSSVVQNRREQG
ncbi:hypothetical protein GCK32_008824, partial [Trichostrongylus colubriformis]